jgi:hypothetical protein
VPETSGERVVVAIVTPLESELLEPIRAVADGIELRYEPNLLRPVRYPGDHHGVEGFNGPSTPTPSAAGKNCSGEPKGCSDSPTTRRLLQPPWCEATRDCAGCRRRPPARASRSRRG